MECGASDSLDSHSPEETQRIGQALGELLCGGEVIALRGDLGAGKTCFVQGLARGLAVPDEAPVTSPTFVLVGEYPGRIPLRHADFYRVDSYARLEDAGFDDLIGPDGVLVVEWPQRFPDALPPERIDVRIEVVGASSRRLVLSGTGDRARELVRRLRKTWQ